MPTPTPSVKKPTGTLTVALSTIGVPLFRNAKAPYPRNAFHWAFGVCETLTMWKPGTTEQTGMVAESWEFASDMSELVVHVRPGVQFHKGWGEVTAEDVAFSYNDAGADNPETIHDNGAEIAATYTPWEVRDKYTVWAGIETVRPKPDEYDINREGFTGPPCIFSKKVFDEVGAEAAVTTMVATGPYEAVEWTSGKQFVGEAVEDHWRVVPNFKTLIIQEVPEEATRMAMIETGQVDIADISLKNISTLVDKGFKANDSMGLYWTNTVYMAGNYWQEKDINGETVFPREGFKPDDKHPWIGDPRDAARMESARKVRWAMSMAIDREALVEEITGGLARIAYLPAVPSVDPLFKQDWVIPYDPDAAKKLLAEAGYPNGFELDYFYPPDFPIVVPEAAEAVAVMWGDIGLKVNIERTAYTTRRPTLMQRQIDIPWYWFVDLDPSNYDPYNIWLQSAGPWWNGGMEFQELHDFRQQVLAAIKAGDIAERNRVVQERGDWVNHQQVYLSVFDKPKLMVENPNKVKGWTMYFSLHGHPNNFETIQPAQ